MKTSVPSAGNYRAWISNYLLNLLIHAPVTCFPISKSHPMEINLISIWHFWVEWFMCLNSHTSVMEKATNFTLSFQYAVFAKIIGHVGHFRWLGPKSWWEISQLWIKYIKSIRQMSDEPWKFVGYTAVWMLFIMLIGVLEWVSYRYDFNFKCIKAGTEWPSFRKWHLQMQEIVITWLEFHWILFPRVQSTRNEHWLR